MAFHGWPAEALEFYEGLAADNTKAYWTAHRAVYEQQVRAPMAALLAELEPEFGAGKIFRPFRDVRFSADKSPYKTAIAATLARGGYVQLSADGLAAGSGMYVMAPDQLARYREAVADDRTGEELQAVVAGLTRRGLEIVGHDRLKTAPKGYPKDHPRIGLLRLKGLVAWRQWPVAPWLGTAAAKRRIVEFLRMARSLDEWLETYVGPSELPPDR
ncbi:MAG: TIGR02453 family protein [Streptosporangiales bacterium]|nr:TIGR02453 family protein [Streptosporangiales bacterium]